MGITDTTSKLKYNGDGVTTEFSFPFKVFNDEDLKVILIDSSGVEIIQTFQTSYTASVNTDEGGTVTMVVAPASGEKLFIKKYIANTQPTSLGFGPLPKAELEEMSDRATLQIQQLEEKMNRAPTLPETTDIEDPSIEEPSEGYTPRWDASGNLINSTYSEAQLGTATVSSVNTTSGEADAAKNISTDANGYLDPTFKGSVVSVTSTGTISNYCRLYLVSVSGGQITANLPSTGLVVGKPTRL